MPKQQVYLSKLLGYDYTIQYKVGKSNLVVDALSWVPVTSAGQLLVLSTPNFVFLDDLRKALQVSTEFQQLMPQV